MTHRVVVEPRAERDLWDSARWIEKNSKSTAIALRWARGIRAKMTTLKSHPQRCPVADESDAFGEEVRQLLYGKQHGVYRVLFTIRGESVHVLTIRHSARGFVES